MHTATPLHHHVNVSVGDSCELPRRQNWRKQQKNGWRWQQGKQGIRRLLHSNPLPLFFTDVSQLVDVECTPTSCSCFFLIPLRLHSPLCAAAPSAARLAAHTPNRTLREKGGVKEPLIIIIYILEAASHGVPRFFPIGKRTPPSSVHNMHWALRP